MNIAESLEYKKNKHPIMTMNDHRTEI